MIWSGYNHQDCDTFKTEVFEMEDNILVGIL